MRNKIHKHPKANTNGFDKNPQNINRDGRPISIRNQLKELLSSDGSLLIPSCQVKQINEDGSVLLNLPTQKQLALQLATWAMSNKGNDSLKALQMIIHQVDGMPKQEITNHITTPTKVDSPYKVLSKDQMERIDDVLNEV